MQQQAERESLIDVWVEVNDQVDAAHDDGRLTAAQRLAFRLEIDDALWGFVNVTAEQLRDVARKYVEAYVSPIGD